MFRLLKLGDEMIFVFMITALLMFWLIIHYLAGYIVFGVACLVAYHFYKKRKTTDKDAEIRSIK